MEIWIGVVHYLDKLNRNYRHFLGMLSTAELAVKQKGRRHPFKIEMGMFRGGDEQDEHGTGAQARRPPREGVKNSLHRRDAEIAEVRGEFILSLRQFCVLCVSAVGAVCQLSSQEQLREFLNRAQVRDRLQIHPRIPSTTSAWIWRRASFIPSVLREGNTRLLKTQI